MTDKRPPGRPPIPEDQRLQLITIRLTYAHQTWLRDPKNMAALRAWIAKQAKRS